MSQNTIQIPVTKIRLEHIHPLHEDDDNNYRKFSNDICIVY